MIRTHKVTVDTRSHTHTESLSVLSKNLQNLSIITKSK